MKKVLITLLAITALPTFAGTFGIELQNPGTKETVKCRLDASEISKNVPGTNHAISLDKAGDTISISIYKQLKNGLAPILVMNNQAVEESLSWQMGALNSFGNDRFSIGIYNLDNSEDFMKKYFANEGLCQDENIRSALTD